jgi:hypothetical protein
MRWISVAILEIMAAPALNARIENPLTRGREISG